MKTLRVVPILLQNKRKLTIYTRKSQVYNTPNNNLNIPRRNKLN